MSFAGTEQRRPTGHRRKNVRGGYYVDYKATDDLRRCLTPNGKMYSRKRLGSTAGEQRKVAKAIKQARFMALLPYTSATV